MERSKSMNVSKWAYDAAICDPAICPGDCDLCDIAKNPEKYALVDEEEAELRYEAEFNEERRSYK